MNTSINYPKGSIEDLRELIRKRMTDEQILVILRKDLPDRADGERRKLIEEAHKPETPTLPELYYDGTKYWIENANGNWITIRVEDVRRELKNAGLYGAHRMAIGLGKWIKLLVISSIINTLTTLVH